MWMTAVITKRKGNSKTGERFKNWRQQLLDLPKLSVSFRKQKRGAVEGTMTLL